MQYEIAEVVGEWVWPDSSRRGVTLRAAESSRFLLAGLTIDLHVRGWG
jgi:hypothetical protein